MTTHASGATAVAGDTPRTQPDPRIGDNPTGRPRRSSAGTRRRKSKGVLAHTHRWTRTGDTETCRCGAWRQGYPVGGAR